jgi:hypothetical protein
VDYYFVTKDQNDEAVAIGHVEKSKMTTGSKVAVIIEDRPGLKCVLLTEGQFGTYQAFKSLLTLKYMALTDSRISEEQEVHIFSFEKGEILDI